jgi:hypothetical protein
VPAVTNVLAAPACVLFDLLGRGRKICSRASREVEFNVGLHRGIAHFAHLADGRRGGRSTRLITGANSSQLTLPAIVAALGGFFANSNAALNETPAFASAIQRPLRALDALANDARSNIFLILISRRGLLNERNCR